MNILNVKGLTFFRGKLAKICFGIVVGYIALSYFMSLTAFVSPTQEQRWDTGIDALSETSYGAGEVVTINGYLREGTQFLSNGEYFSFTSPETITWVVTIIDPVNTPVYYADGVINDAQGNIQLDPLTYTVPNSPRIGTYRIRVYVLTDYLPTGDLRLNLVNEGTFEVI